MKCFVINIDKGTKVTESSLKLDIQWNKCIGLDERHNITASCP